MLKKIRTLSIDALALTLGLTLFPVLLLAQEVVDPKPDITQVGIAAITALTPVLSGLVLWVLKAAWSKIPASMVLIAAPIVGIAVNFATAYIASHPPTSLLLAAALGALSVYLREFASTIQTKGWVGEVSATKFML